MTSSPTMSTRLSSLRVSTLTVSIADRVELGAAVRPRGIAVAVAGGRRAAARRTAHRRRGGHVGRGRVRRLNDLVGEERDIGVRRRGRVDDAGAGVGAAAPGPAAMTRLDRLDELTRVAVTCPGPAAPSTRSFRPVNHRRHHVDRLQDDVDLRLADGVFAGPAEIEQVLDLVGHVLDAGDAERARVALDRVERPEQVVQQLHVARCAARAPAPSPRSSPGGRALRRRTSPRVPGRPAAEPVRLRRSRSGPCCARSCVSIVSPEPHPCVDIARAVPRGRPARLPDSRAPPGALRVTQTCNRHAETRHETNLAGRRPQERRGAADSRSCGRTCAHDLLSAWG